MGYMTDGLTFNVLRQANLRRLPEFRNKKGEVVHSKPDGSDWPLSQWGNALFGEIGEAAEAWMQLIAHAGAAANLIKKIERGDVALEEARDQLGEEYADIATYLSIISLNSGVDLGAAIVAKFNKISVRAGSRVRIREDGSDWYYAETSRFTDNEIDPREED